MNPSLLTAGISVVVLAVGLYYCFKRKVKVTDKNEKKEVEKKEKIVVIEEEIREKEKVVIKTPGQLEVEYGGYYYGVMSLHGRNVGVTAMCLRNGKALVATTKNELVSYDLQKWRKESAPERKFISLENNSASAVTIGNKYYYACLNFDKTVVYYSVEGGHFKEENRFKRNVLRSNASSIGIDEAETVIITTGNETDSTINVWSMAGDLLHQINTYQLEQYEVRHAGGRMAVRGWTSEVKIFESKVDRLGHLLSIEKTHHLPHSVQPKCCALDQFYAVTADSAGMINIWLLASGLHHSLLCSHLKLETVVMCLVYTVEDENQQKRTITAFGDGLHSIAICDRHFTVLLLLEGVEHSEIFIIGTNKKLVFATLNRSGRLTLWDITSLLTRIELQSF